MPSSVFRSPAASRTFLSQMSEFAEKEVKKEEEKVAAEDPEKNEDGDDGDDGPAPVRLTIINVFMCASSADCYIFSLIGGRIHCSICPCCPA